MRRKDKEISDKNEIEDLLASSTVGRLGTCANGIPYITPMNFTYDKETSKIFLHCANEGRKLDNIRINPTVCFEVEEVKKCYCETTKLCIFSCLPLCYCVWQYKNTF